MGKLIEKFEGLSTVTSATSQACLRWFKHSSGSDLCSVTRVQDSSSRMLVVSIGSAYRYIVNIQK